MRKRVGRRGIFPTSTKSRHIAQDSIKNTSTSNVTFTFNDSTTITITSRTFSTANVDFRLGTLPFMVAFYEAASLAAIDPGTNQIPNDTTTGDYNITQLAMPGYTVNGKHYYDSGSSQIRFATNGDDVVYKTSIENTSGGAKTVTALIQARIIQSRGSGA